MKSKVKFDSSFFKKKWFKLLVLSIFFGWLFYIFGQPFEIKDEILIELNVTTKDELKTGGSRDPIKLYFKTIEYSNSFGIYVGGTFGRWTEVKNSLKSGRRLVIKVKEEDIKKLNSSSETIPIFYLKDSNIGLIFNEQDFENGEKKSFNRVAAFFVVIFVVCLIKIFI